MLIEQEKRPARVRFRHPIRVVTLDGQPRVLRTLTGNVSRKGLFLRMPQPLAKGTKVALSLEAGGRALALAQAEVMWGRASESRDPGCGVKFTEFMHPRAQELVDYLVHNLGRGKPLTLARKAPRWGRVRVPAVAAMVALFVGILVIPLLSQGLAEAREQPRSLREESRVGPALSEEVVLDSAPTALEPPVEGAVLVAAPTEQHPPVEQAVLGAAPTEAEPPVEGAVLVAAPTEQEPPVEGAVLGAARTEAGPPEAVLGAAPMEQEPPVEKAVLAPARTAPATPSAPKVRRAEAKKPERRGEVKLPTGAAPRLTWTVTGTELRLAPELEGQAHLMRAFVLEGPPRVVFDVAGAVPKRSLTVPASPPYATAVRLGKQATGTRIVVDLDAAPKRSRQDDGALVLSF